MYIYLLPGLSSLTCTKLSNSIKLVNDRFLPLARHLPRVRLPRKLSHRPWPRPLARAQTGEEPKRKSTWMNVKGTGLHHRSLLIVTHRLSWPSFHTLLNPRALWGIWDQTFYMCIENKWNQGFLMAGIFQFQFRCRVMRKTGDFDDHLPDVHKQLR